jgi:hypothetical protein
MKTVHLLHIWAGLSKNEQTIEPTFVRRGLLPSRHFEAGACFAVEADIEVAASTGDLAPDQFDDLADSFYAKFNDMVGRVTETLGEPSFCDGAAADGFPDDQDAVWLALWVGDGLRIMVQQKNEGRDMPFRVTLVCAP